MVVLYRVPPSVTSHQSRFCGDPPRRNGYTGERGRLNLDRVPLKVTRLRVVLFHYLGGSPLVRYGDPGLRLFPFIHFLFPEKPPHPTSCSSGFVFRFYFLWLSGCTTIFLFFDFTFYNITFYHCDKLRKHGFLSGSFSTPRFSYWVVLTLNTLLFFVL